MCSLVGKWKIFQKQGGHRFSTDDVTTAWVACKVIKELQERGVDVSTHLDMGCGLGSVLMMVGWKYPHLQSTGIEAQKISCELARRSLRYNGAADRISVVNGICAIPRCCRIPRGSPSLRERLRTSRRERRRCRRRWTRRRACSSSAEGWRST